MKKVKKISKIFNSIVVSSLKNIPEYYHLEANQAECQKLAERFELVEILSLKADITMFRDDFVYVKGKISAQIRRQSVISLKEFTEKMDENFENLFCEPPIPETDEIIDETDKDIKRPYNTTFLRWIAKIFNWFLNLFRRKK